MTERKKIIELAKRLSVVEGGIHLFDEIALVAFYHIAQKEILEQAAEICKRNEFTVIAESQIRQLIEG